MIVIEQYQFNASFLASVSLETALQTCKSIPEQIVKQAFKIANPAPKRVRSKK